MSKPDLTTRARVLARARELFNAHGLEQVGVRELARDLGLSPGNLSYHFPRKEDLVGALMAELRVANAATLEPRGASTVNDFLERTRATLRRQYEYRCLARSLTHLVQAFPALGAEYRRTERERRRSLGAMLETLWRERELTGPTDDAGRARLVGVCTLVARFWLSETALSYPGLAADRAVAHYLSLLAHALLPHARPATRKALAPYLAGVEVAQTLALTPAREDRRRRPRAGR